MKFKKDILMRSIENQNTIQEEQKPMKFNFDLISKEDVAAPAHQDIDTTDNKSEDIEILKAEIVSLNKRLDEVMELLKVRSICPTKTRIDISIDTIRALQAQGLSNYKIAKQLGCSEGTIRNRLKGVL